MPFVNVMELYIYLLSLSPPKHAHNGFGRYDDHDCDKGTDCCILKSHLPPPVNQSVLPVRVCAKQGLHVFVRACMHVCVCGCACDCVLVRVLVCGCLSA